MGAINDICSGPYVRSRPSLDATAITAGRTLKIKKVNSQSKTMASSAALPLGKYLASTGMCCGPSLEDDIEPNSIKKRKHATRPSKILPFSSRIATMSFQNQRWTSCGRESSTVRRVDTFQ
jgi:hypothetical protein